MRRLYGRYPRWFVSKLGSLLSGNRGAYHYLAESAVQFYTSEELKEMWIISGSCQTLFYSLSEGLINIYVATK